MDFAFLYKLPFGLYSG